MSENNATSQFCKACVCIFDHIKHEHRLNTWSQLHYFHWIEMRPPFCAELSMFSSIPDCSHFVFSKVGGGGDLLINFVELCQIYTFWYQILKLMRYTPNPNCSTLKAFSIRTNLKLSSSCAVKFTASHHWNVLKWVHINPYHVTELWPYPGFMTIANRIMV